MNGKNTASDVVESPHYTTEANDDQGSVHESAKRDLPKLSGDTAFEHIANRVKLWVVGIADEVEHTSAHNFAAH